MLTKKFYIEFGKVLYALAMADGKIQAEEREMLVKLVRRVIKPLDNQTDEFGTDLSYYVEFSFEAQAEYKRNPERMLDGFFNYLEKDKVKLTTQHKKVVIWVLEKVADAYGGTEVAEAALILDFINRLNNYKG